MSVRVQVSSMKTSRSASTRPWYFVHWARRRATSGRSRSPAATLFFEAELLGMHEIPHRVVVDLQAASGEFRNEPAYGEIAVSDPLRQPGRKSPEIAFGLWPPIWPGSTLPVSS